MALVPPSSSGAIVDQGSPGATPWLVSINGVPHVVVDSATIDALTDGSQRVGGTVAVDGSGHTQPVSGTVGATQGSSPWFVDGSAVVQPVSGTFWQGTQPVSLASAPLPDDAATDDAVDRVKVAVRMAAFDSWLRHDETRWS